MAVLWLHQFDVAIVYACHLDEVHHLVVWYGERRVLTIFICGEVVIIIGEKVQFGSILDAMIYDLRTYVDKEKAWKIRFDDKLALALDVFQCAVQRQETFYTYIKR